MGRHSTGALTTNESLTIEIKYLLENGYIRKDAIVIRPLSWFALCNGETVFTMSVYSDFTGEKKYIRFSYEIMNPNTGETENNDYKIFIVAVPSNLGKGEIFYFICPVSGHRCRVLYKAYDSDIFKCRQAYNPRIYYSLQKFSKLYQIPAKYWMLNDEYDELPKKRKTNTYKGKKTKRAIKTLKLQGEIIDAYLLMRSPVGMPKILRSWAKRMGF